MRSAAVVSTRTEHEVQTGIRKLARAIGFHVTDFSQGYRPGGPRHATTRQTPGVPDLLLMHPSRQVALFVECKRLGGSLSKAQREWHQIAEQSGLKVSTCDSVESFAEQLRAFGWKLTPAGGRLGVAR